MGVRNLWVGHSLGYVKESGRQMRVFKKLSVDEILPQLGEDKPRISVMEYEGEIITVKPDSLRLLCLQRSQVCVECGRVGIEFRVEAHEEKGKASMPPHLALYSGDGVLMTKALIDLNGRKHISNTQTMCRVCNDKRMGTTPKRRQ